MGQKVNPIGLRLGINRTWDSRWFADGAEYGKLLHEDIKVRKCAEEAPEAGRRLAHHHRASAQEVPRHDLCRPSRRDHRQEGRGHREAAQGLIAAMTEGEVHLNIVEVRKPETDAQLVAENIAQQLERRIAFRRAMKRVDAVGHASRRQGHPHQRLGPPRRRGNRADGMVPRRPRAAAHPARRHRLRLQPKPRRPTASSA